jgi:hypothetical protein
LDDLNDRGDYCHDQYDRPPFSLSMTTLIIECCWQTWRRPKVTAGHRGEKTAKRSAGESRANPDLNPDGFGDAPELDGIEATRQLRQRRAHSRTPIFAISACHATHDVKDDALAAGCTQSFLKPLDLIITAWRRNPIDIGPTGLRH